MYPPEFRYHRASSVQEALSLLQQNPDAKLLAGGHSLLPALKLRLSAPPALIDLGKVPGLSRIRQEGDAWLIGAMTTHRALEFSQVPLLAEVAKEIGDPPVRNRGTIGGALAHADPAADYPAAVLALDATLKAVGPSGEREIAADDFFVAVFTAALDEQEILTEIRVPVLGKGAGAAYAKFHHPASGYAVCGVAAKVRAENNAVRELRLGVTGAGYQAFRATSVEQALSGKALDAATIDSATQGAFDVSEMADDHFASAEYRAQLCRVMTRRALLSAWQRATG